jgi:hypothetical protein
MASAVSVDGGNTWVAGEALGSLEVFEADSNGFTDIFEDDDDKEFLAVGPDFADTTRDRFAVAWQRNGVIFVSTSTDGIGWSTPVQVSNRDDAPALRHRHRLDPDLRPERRDLRRLGGLRREWRVEDHVRRVL